MERSIIEVPGISAGIRRVGVPLSPGVRANGFVFVSGTPPFDLATGAFVKGDIARQTEQCLLCVQKVLEAAGSPAITPGSTRSTPDFSRKRRRRAALCPLRPGRSTSTSRLNASHWLEAPPGLASNPSFTLPRTWLNTVRASWPIPAHSTSLGAQPV